ncbi:DUF4012 domain-containing protein [Pengzhenrongella frigida]|uniref:DUF4012 domain-containing protein n=1 Tax=Pengzhenrongella frigida TaxID=1259133 RepID=A0A4Q5MWH4_9MICO|nr:DUF4012 domain-containing protein [Cellulomonas sp. HLT2-17]RYV49919.1 DUF4012 domain-containing protein [Cellulomonas sp. HLT2-17]
MSAPVDATHPGSTPDPTPPVRVQRARPRRSRRRRTWRIALLTTVVLVLAAGGWLAFRGWQAATSLLHAEQIVQDVRTGLADVDTASVADRLPELEADAATARAATSDPVWRVAAHLPFVGPSFAAVATVSAALDDVAGIAGPTLDEIDTIAQVQGLRGTDGRIDLAPLAEAAPALVRAAAVVGDADDAVAGIDPDRLVGPLAGPVEQVQEGMAEVSALLDGTARFAGLLPPMLGLDGPRTYLLLSLNSAELRTAGGIVGAVAVIRAENGSIELVDQRTTLDFPATDEPVLPLTDEEVTVHTDRLGRWIQNTVMTPDFPRTAELVTAIWRSRTGEEVDGVIATDAVAIANLLEATGPIDEPGGLTLTTDNFLDELLHESYLRLRDPVEADGFFTGVASTIFRAVGDGQGEARRVVEELGKASSKHRLRVWSAHPEEQSELVQTSAGGAFLSGGADDAAGVFLDDGTTGKLDYFLTTDVQVEDVRCEADSTTAVVRVDLAYDPPADITEYPEYVTGPRGSNLPTGSVATNLTVYAPVGGEIVEMRLGDGFIGGLTATESGRAVEVLSSRLAPGERATYRFEVRTPRAVPELPVWLTPTMTSPGIMTAACG